MYIRTTSIAVVLIFLIASLTPLVPLYGDTGGSDGSPHPGSITISSAEQLALIGVDDRYPLDGRYVQTADIDFDGLDFNSGFDVVVKAVLDGKTLTISISHDGGTPMTSDSDICVYIDAVMKPITPGKSSVDFDVDYMDVLEFTTVLAGNAIVFKVGADGNFAVGGKFEMRDSETKTSVFKNNGNMNPIGSTEAFSGIYDGNGFSIRGLKVSSHTLMNNSYAAMFAGIGSSAMLRNIDLGIDSVAAAYYVYAYAGGLVASVGGRNVSIIDSYVTGNIISAASFMSSAATSGGLVGSTTGSLFTENCHISAYVATLSPGLGGYAGGLVGYADGNLTANACHVTGDVAAYAGTAGAGGLAGHTNGATITGCFVSGDVSSTPSASTSMMSTSSALSGGLVGGIAKAADISDCYVNGNVSSISPDGSSGVSAGGLVGHADKAVRIANCYVTGSVTSEGKDAVAGAVGNFKGSESRITNCYFLKTGTINPSLDLFGAGTPVIDGGATGRTQPSGGYGNLKMKSVYYTGTAVVDGNDVKGWDFSTIWYISSSVNNGYPMLRIMTAVTDPLDSYVRIGGTAEFKVNVNEWVTGIRWQSYDNGTWRNISGETGMTLTVGNVKTTDIGRIYRCVVTYSVGGVQIGSAVSGPAQILLADTVPVIEISDAYRLSKIGSDAIIGNQIFRPDGVYVQTADIEMPVPDSNDINGGFPMVIKVGMKESEYGLLLSVSLHYADAARTGITSSTLMSVSVGGNVVNIDAGESKANMMIQTPYPKVFEMVAGGNADNIPTGMDDSHRGFVVAATFEVDAGSRESEVMNSNGNMDPLGMGMWPFSGTFDGNGFSIRGLNISVFSVTDAYAGLFGHIGTATLRNVHITEGVTRAVSITALGDTPSPDPTEMEMITDISFCGGLAAYSGKSLTIIDCSYDGSIAATSIAFCGGLLGLSEGNVSITGSHTTADVAGAGFLAMSGGLIAAVGGDTYIADSYATGEISSKSAILSVSGGIGAMLGGMTVVERCYSSGDIYTAGGIIDMAGGIAGIAYSSTITDSYATGDISAASSGEMLSAVGGIVGMFNGQFSVTNCYITGELKGDAMMSYIYAAGFSQPPGGYGETETPKSYITNFYYLRTDKVNTDLEMYSDDDSGVIVDGGMTGGQQPSGDRTPEELRSVGTYYDGARSIDGRIVRGWDFRNIWCIDTSGPVPEARVNGGFPFLRSTAISVQPVNAVARDVIGSTFSVTAGVEPTGYRWQKGDGDTWNDIPGATGSSYTTSSKDGFGDRFRCVVTFGSMYMQSDSVELLRLNDVTASYNSARGSVMLSSDTTTSDDVLVITTVPEEGYKTGTVKVNSGTLTKVGDNEYIVTNVTKDVKIVVGFNDIPVPPEIDNVVYFAVAGMAVLMLLYVVALRRH